MAVASIKELVLKALIVIALPVCQVAYGDSRVVVETYLPALPEGVVEAGDIVLTAEKSLTDVNIPGLTRTESKRLGVDFRNRDDVVDKPLTLDKEGARKMADAFLDRYFPSITDRIRFRGCGSSTTSRFRGPQGEDAITGYDVWYIGEYKGICIVDERVSVEIKNDEVARVKVRMHSVREVSELSKLLSAEECLERVSEKLLEEYPTCNQIRVEYSGFGYAGRFKQSWEDPVEDWSEPFRAVPVYWFGVFGGLKGGMGRRYAFDARTGELLHPRRPKGNAQAELAGPELVFEEAGSRRLFLIGPRDVEIEKAVFELENVPVEDTWRTYRARDVLVNREGEWSFTDGAAPDKGYLCLSSNWAHRSKAAGSIEVETAGPYEVELLVYQGAAGDKARSLRVNIDGKSRILGTKGPDTVRVWERWGEIELSKGSHEIDLEAAPDSKGSWEVGGVRLRHLADPGVNVSRVEDLKITFGRRDRPDYRNELPLTGRFVTKDLSGRMRSEFRRAARSKWGQNIMSVSMSSDRPGIVRLESLRVSFIAGDQDIAEKKAEQFVVIYPDGGSSRLLLPEELRVFSWYIEQILDSRRRWDLGLYESVDLCEFARNLVGGYDGDVVQEILGGLERKHLELALEEAERLANSFHLYESGSPPPLEYVKGWDEKLLWYREMFDQRRVVDNSTYLDCWNRPYVFRFLKDERRVRVRSCGPNGEDESGGGDDIEAEAELSSLRW